MEKYQSTQIPQYIIDAVDKCNTPNWEGVLQIFIDLLPTQYEKYCAKKYVNHLTSISK